MAANLLNMIAKQGTAMQSLGNSPEPVKSSGAAMGTASERSLMQTAVMILELGLEKPGRHSWTWMELSEVTQNHGLSLEALNGEAPHEHQTAGFDDIKA